MKRMLIIGNEYPGVKSIPWNSAVLFNITDYQIVLLDLTTFEVDDLAIDEIEKITFSIKLLLESSHTVIYILPRKAFKENYHNKILPFGLRLITSSGVTLNFQNENLMNLYKQFVTKHDVVFSGVNSQYNIGGQDIRILPLIWNNIDVLCSFKWDTMYLLHPPDLRLHNKAIESLVDYFSPDMEEEKEEKPSWITKYELEALGLQKIESDIKDIEQEIAALSHKRDEKILKKEKIAQWGDLIVKQGKTLEIRIKEAFELLGVKNVIHEPKGIHGPDLEINYGTMWFTVEIEGSKGSIKIEKARELLHWLADAPPEYKGMLIGNTFREISPIERPPKNHKLFVKEAEDLAQSRNFVLVDSYDLFQLVCRKLKNEEVRIDEILNRIYNGKGVVNLI